jgi:bacillithiol biosynthesis cysteine-adding enzyme BshC
VTGAGPAVRVEHLGPAEGPGTSAFARALRSGEGAPLAFLPAPPADEAGWARALERAAAAVPRVPPELAERLAARQAALESGPRAEANARALADPRAPALAVVTGQQPGLLGGPLLTLHKAAGALALARHLDGVGGFRVVPVFWLASEDHDADEANTATLLDRHGQPRRLRLPVEGDGRSLIDLPVPPEASAALEAELAGVLPDTSRGRAARALAARRDGEDFATWAARILAGLLGDSGLVVVEPLELTPWVGATYDWLLEHAAPIREAIGTSARALRAAGLAAPLGEPEPDATPLFLRPEPGGRRLRVGLDPAGRVTLRDEPGDLDAQALRALVRAEPLRASGNVVGRVFVQNRHLPVLAYVAGPTEIAYWAQLRAAHQALGLLCPLALPRPEATWTDAKTDAALAAQGLDVAALLRHEPLPDPAPAGAAIPEVAEVEACLERAAGVAEAHAARRGPAAAALGRAVAAVRRAWEKALPGVRAALDQDAVVGAQRLARALAFLQPRERTQERVLSPLSLVARYGVEALRLGLKSLDPLRPGHHVVHLEGERSAGHEEPPG